MTDTANLFLEVDNLKTYFFLHEGTVAVDGVSFKLYKGKSLA